MDVTTANNNNTLTDQNQIGTPNKVEEIKPEASDRTKEQFEKLTASNTKVNQENERLRKELDGARRAAEQVKKEPAPKSTPKDIPSNIDLESFVEVDPKTGEKYVNETKLTKAMSDLKSQTTKAKDTIQSYIKTNENRRIQQQKDDAFIAYPELKPENEKFDQKFYKTVRAVLYDSMMNANEYGKTLTLKEAADYVRKDIIPTPPVVKPEEEKTEKKEVSNAKAQAGTMVPSQPQNAPSPTVSDELKQLRLATRRGDINALAQRILATDHVKKA